MRSIRDFDLNNKTVVLRCDLNVTIKNNRIVSDQKIILSLRTINYILDNGAKLIILSHLGKVKTIDDKDNNSLRIVCRRLNEFVDSKIKFLPYTRNEKIKEEIDKLDYGKGILLENTRFEDLDNKKESNMDDDLSLYWASLGDIFINDAFGMVHRLHASNYGIAKHIPSGIGFLMEEELSKLNKLDNPKRPFGVIMGGIKISDKLKVINKLIKKCDCIYVGGAMANTFLKALGYNIGNCIYEEDLLDYCLDLYKKYKDKIILPVDFVGKSNRKVITVNVDNIPDDFVVGDIGKKTIKLFSKNIKQNNTIFWNGPLGIYEDKDYEKGTKSIMKYVSKVSVSIIGGGDTMSASIKFNYYNKLTFVSSGGGATLEYICDSNLQSLEVFK